MRLVLLFCTWLTLCYSSLSANGVNTPIQKDTQISTSIDINIQQKKKSSTYAKIKVQSTKARLFTSESVIPDTPFKIKNVATLSPIDKAIYWNTFENFSDLYIFSYLYPKHAFW